MEAYDLNPESKKVEEALDKTVEQACQDNKVGHRLAIVHRLLALGGLLHVLSFIAVAILIIFFISSFLLYRNGSAGRRPVAET